MQGSHLCEQLIEMGHEVVGIDDYSRGTFEAEYIHRLDLSNGSYHFNFSGYDTVLHLAAQVWGVEVARSHNWEMLRHNMQVDLNVLNACVEAGVKRVIYPSTACVYPVRFQDRWDALLLEEMVWQIPKPESGYGWAKLMGEVQVRHLPTEWTIFRFFNVYGDGENAGAGSHVIPELIRKVLAAPADGEMEVYGTGEQGRTFLHVDDAVRAYIAALDCEPGVVMNCGSPDPIKIKDLAALICEIDGRGVKPVFNSEKPTGVMGRTPDIETAKDVLGWEPQISLAEGVRRTYDYYKANVGAKT